MRHSRFMMIGLWGFQFLSVAVELGTYRRLHQTHPLSKGLALGAVGSLCAAVFQATSNDAVRLTFMSAAMVLLIAGFVVIRRTARSIRAAQSGGVGATTGSSGWFDRRLGVRLPAVLSASSLDRQVLRQPRETVA